jgi:hypothetical protein
MKAADKKYQAKREQRSRKELLKLFPEPVVDLLIKNADKILENLEPFSEDLDCITD